jgi:hypothetical protein
MLVRMARRNIPTERDLLGRVPAGAQMLIYDADFIPYWERENTGDPELFAQEYIDLCINKLYPDVPCPGKTSIWQPRMCFAHGIYSSVCTPGREMPFLCIFPSNVLVLSW